MIAHPARLCRITVARIWVCAWLLAGCSHHDGGAKKAQSRPPEVARHGLSAEQAARVLVQVGARVITLGDFADRLADQSPYLRARYASPERRREFLENLIRFELLAHEATRQGYEQRPEVQRVRQQAMVQQMMSELFEEGTIAPERITEKEIAAFYKAHPEEFHKPRQVRASHIVIKNRALAQRTLAAALRDPNDMQAFRRLAAKYNEDAETSARLGDLRFFGETAADDGDGNRPQIPAQVRKAAFSLSEVGDVFPELVESEHGFHIVKLTAKRAALDRNLQDAERMIRNRLWREKRQAAIEAFVTELRRKANVQEDLSLLSQVSVPAPDAGLRQGTTNTMTSDR